jgi:cyclophilin family peptidyl-prolyl cis-trans isomerase
MSAGRTRLSPRSRPRARVVVRRAVAILVLAGVAGVARAQQPIGPVIVVETARGAFEIETYPDDAPKTVRHIVDLVKRGFYDGQRVHRATPGFVVQWGDPQSREPARRAEWGRGPAASSGNAIGAVEFSKRRLHVRGAVGVAHLGNPATADSQIYVTLANRPELNGRYVVFGRVVSGMDVPGTLQGGDLIMKMSVRP